MMRVAPISWASSVAKVDLPARIGPSIAMNLGFSKSLAMANSLRSKSE